MLDAATPGHPRLARARLLQGLPSLWEETLASALWTRTLLPSAGGWRRCRERALGPQGRGLTPGKPALQTPTLFQVRPLEAGGVYQVLSTK